MTAPGTYAPDDAPKELIELADRLMRLLLAGDDTSCAVLRAQYARAEIREVELSGVGFFVSFAVPRDAPRTDPRDFGGGHVTILLEGVESGAGCVLFVRGGALELLEAYTYDQAWPDSLRVLALTDARPVRPP